MKMYAKFKMINTKIKNTDWKLHFTWHLRRYVVHNFLFYQKVLGALYYYLHTIKHNKKRIPRPYGALFYRPLYPDHLITIRKHYAM